MTTQHGDRPLAPFSPLVLRLALGTIFLAHGAQKILGWFSGPGLSGAGHMFDAMGFHPGVFWAVVATLTEVGGGAAILVGWWTRWAALAIAAEMIVAAIKVHLPNGFFMNWMAQPGHGIEYNLALIGMALALAFRGAGKFSLDCRRCCKK